MPAVSVQKVHTLTGHRDCLYTLAPAGAEGSFFSAGGDGMVVQWEQNKPEEGKLLARAEASVYAMEYLPERDWLFFGQNYDGIRHIQASSKKSLGSLQLTKAAIFSIAHWQDKLLVGTGDGFLHIVQQQPLKLLKSLPLAQKSLRSLAIHPERQEVAAAFSDHHIRILDLNTLQKKYEIAAHQNSVFSVQYSPDGKYLLSGSRDAHLKIWNTRNAYELEESIVAHLYAINDVQYSPNGLYFASCSMDKSIKVWNAQSFKLLKVIDKARHAGHGTSVNKLLWPEENLLVSASDDRTISVWKLDFQQQNLVKNH